MNDQVDLSAGSATADRQSTGVDDEGSTTAGNRAGDALVVTLSAIVWIAVVLIRLRRIDESWWIARDDAVITLSHAKNFADHGTIGISPGDRVEATSSPLHFLAATAVELVSSPGYRTLSMVLLIVAIGVAGAGVGFGMLQLARGGLSRSRASVAAVSASLIAVIALSASWTAVGWIGSGMENPFIVAAGLAVLALVASGPGSRSRSVSAALAVSALAISRVEFAAFIVPLAIAAAVAIEADRPGGPRWRRVALVAGAPVAASIVLHLARRWYFGEWLPNTALVQGRASGADQRLVLAAVLLLTSAIVVVGLARSTEIVPAAWMPLVLSLAWIVAVVAGVSIVWLWVTGRTSGTLNELALFAPLLPLLAVVILFAKVSTVLGLDRWSLNSVGIALVAIPIGQLIVMGPARLDAHRVLSIVVPFLVVWIVLLGVRLASDIGSRAHGADRFTRISQYVALGAIASVFIGGVAWGQARDRPRPLNYEVRTASSILEVADAVADEGLPDRALPIVANPDLGKISYPKRALIVDLGLLGDPLLTRVSLDHPALIETMLHEVDAPDVVEVHGVFSCSYTTWLTSAAFGERYESESETWSARVADDGCFLAGRFAVWRRIDADGEYALATQILAGDDPAAVVRTSIEACRDETGGAFRCEGVRRAVQRIAQALREDGTFDAVVTEFERSPSAALSVPMLVRGPGWADDATDAFVSLA